MKKLIFTIFIFFAFALTGCGSVEERKAEQAVNTYYDALIEKDYKKAFKELFLYDDSEVISDRTFIECSFVAVLDENLYQGISEKGR